MRHCMKTSCHTKHCEFPSMVSIIDRNQTASDEHSLLPQHTSYRHLNRISSHMSLAEAATDLHCLGPLRIQLENVAVVTSPRRGCWRFVCKHSLTAVYFAFRNVCHQPVNTAEVARISELTPTWVGISLNSLYNNAGKLISEFCYV